jgi:hypothetical protein
MIRDEKEVAMCRMILTAAIFCGALLIPLLVDTAPPSTPVAVAHRVAAPEPSAGPEHR